MTTPRKTVGQLCGWSCFVLLCSSAQGEPRIEATEIETEESPVATSAAWRAPLPMASWATREAAEWRSRPAASVSRLTVVELPPEGMPGTRGAQRVHHALSIGSAAPQRMLRSIGVEASDCAARFRLPTKLRQENGNTSIDVRAQIGLACRF